MVKRGNFLKEMRWKEGSSRDLKADAEIASPVLERLEVIKLIVLTSAKSVQPEKSRL